VGVLFVTDTPVRDAPRAIADISLGVSLLSLDAATYFFVSGSKSERPPSSAKLGVGMGPTRNGFALGARGSF
jgi:hypothetical protein